MRFFTTFRMTKTNSTLTTGAQGHSRTQYMSRITFHVSRFSRLPLDNPHAARDTT